MAECHKKVSDADLEEVSSNSSGVAVRSAEEGWIDAEASGLSDWIDRFDPYHLAGRMVPVS